MEFNEFKFSDLIFENFETLRGNRIRRIKSKVFYLLGFISVVTGLDFISKGELLGATLLFTVFPFLVLYPLVRYLFGGKDSAAAVITTAVVEEVMKHQITKLDRKKRNKYK